MFGKRLAWAALFGVSVCLDVGAQQTVNHTSVSGRITDPSGAVVRSALVTAVEQSTEVAMQTYSDEAGRFRFAYLNTGPYQIRVQSIGFAEAITKLTLTVGGAYDLPVSLTMGQLGQAIEVHDERDQLQSARSEVAGVVTSEEVRTLPLNGRNYLDLSLLLPAVSRTNTNSTQRFAETSAIPGTGVSVAGQRNLANSLIVDGLSANDDAAELAGAFYGQETVKEFQVVTSGGTAEYGRALGGYINVVTQGGSNAFHGNAYDYFRNQRFDARNPLANRLLPLTQNQYGASLGGPIQKNRVFFFSNFEGTQQRTAGIITIDPGATTTINQRLRTVGYRGQAVTTGEYPTTLNTKNYFAKVDARPSANDQASLRYNFYDVSSLNSRNVGGLSTLSRAAALYDRDQTFSLSNVATFGAHLFNETRLQYTRSRLEAPVNDPIGPAINISGVANLGTAGSSPTGRAIDAYEAVDNVALQAGAHTLKAGVDFLYNDVNIVFPGLLQGQYTFSSVARLMTGQYENFQQAFGPAGQWQSNPNVAIYLQDEWRVNSRLIVNAGVRYDLQFLEQLVETDTNNVAPRIGFAWTPGNSRRMVVRASYGLYYDRIPLRALSNALQRGNSSLYQTVLLTPAQTGAPVFPNLLSKLPTGVLTNISTIDPHIKNGYSQQASLEIGQEIERIGNLQVAYQHLRGLNLIMSRNLNVPTCATGFNLCRPISTYGNNSQYQSIGDSYYDGMTVSLTRRAARWGSYRISYTLSKAIDDVGAFFFSSPQTNSNVAADRALSDNDARHRVAFSGTAQSPQNAGPGWWGHLRSGFYLSTIVSYGSALPFNVVTGSDNNGDTNVNDRPAGLGRNTGRGFKNVTWDLRLTRSFGLTERLRLDGMAEAFNLLNRTNLQIPNTRFGNGPYPFVPAAGFGAATAAGDARELQLALRLRF